MSSHVGWQYHQRCGSGARTQAHTQAHTHTHLRLYLRIAVRLNLPGIVMNAKYLLTAALLTLSYSFVS